MCTATRHHTYFIRGMRAESFMPEAALEELTKATAAYADQLPEEMLISSYNLRLLDSIGTGKQGKRYTCTLVFSKLQRRYILVFLNCSKLQNVYDFSKYTSYCILLTV